MFNMSHQAVKARSNPCKPLSTSMPSVISRQEIAGRNMDPEKLVSMLDTKFAGAYEVEVRRTELSLSQIADQSHPQ